MHVEDALRMLSQKPTAWPLQWYDAFWQNARANTQLSGDTKIVLSLIIDCVRDAGDEAGWTDLIADETLARAAGCSPEAVCRAIDPLQEANLIHVEKAWINDGERRQVRRYALNEASLHT